MTQEQAIQMAYDMGGHPYSVSSIAVALLKGVEIGKEEQKDIDMELLVDYVETMPQDFTRQDIIDGIIKVMGRYEDKNN